MLQTLLTVLEHGHANIEQIVACHRCILPRGSLTVDARAAVASTRTRSIHRGISKLGRDQRKAQQQDNSGLIEHILILFAQLVYLAGERELRLVVFRLKSTTRYSRVFLPLFSISTFGIPDNNTTIHSTLL